MLSFPLHYKYISTRKGAIALAESLASYIDHTLLRPTATREEIVKLCEEAKIYHFQAVCVHPFWVGTAVEQLKETEVQVATVIGFPLGATTTKVKVTEAVEAVKLGATEIDMVINLGALKSGNKDTVLQDIAEVVTAVQDQALVKVIIETAYLTEEEKKLACQLAKDAGAHYVKTSTGFGPKGATVEDVALMRKVVGEELGVKASGGIRTRADAEAMLEAGASRIGASASLALVTE